MADYLVHLGYDWNSYTLGSVWRAATSTDYWLEYALTQIVSTPSIPALFQFSAGDQLFFRIWDLTQYPANTSPCPFSVSGGIGLNTLGAGAVIYDSATAPVDVSTSNNTLAWSIINNNQPFIAFSTISMAPNPSSSPWAPCMFASDNTLGPLTITATDNIDFKMNFQLQVTFSPVGADPIIKVFFADPETRIGSGRPPNERLRP